MAFVFVKQELLLLCQVFELRYQQYVLLVHVVATRQPYWYKQPHPCPSRSGPRYEAKICSSSGGLCSVGQNRNETQKSAS